MQDQPLVEIQIRQMVIETLQKIKRLSGQLIFLLYLLRCFLVIFRFNIVVLSN